SDIKKLAALPFVHSLSINLTNYPNKQLPDFTKIHHLQAVHLQMTWSQIKELPKLPNVSHLTLYVGGEFPSGVSADQAAIQLEHLIKISTLTSLVLAINDSTISSLPHFGESNGLESVSLFVKRSGIKDMKTLTELKQ